MTEPATEPATTESEGTIVEAVAIFHDEPSLFAAIDDLQEHGFNRAAISLMASEEAVEAKLGHRYERLADAADDPSTPRKAVVAPEDVGAGEGALIGGLAYIGAAAAAGAIVASGGTLLPAALGALAAGAGGGAIGGFLAWRLGHRHAVEVENHLNHGGLLLWVRLANGREEEAARAALARHTNEPVRVHRISTHDPKAAPPPELEPYDVGIPWLFRRKA